MTRSDVRDFQGLIHWLAAEYHAGHFYPIAARTGVSAGLIDQWKRGVVGRPKPESVAKLLKAYPLDAQWVLSLIPSEYVNLMPKRGKRKGAAILLATLSVLGMASTATGSSAAELPAPTRAGNLQDRCIMLASGLRRRRYGWLLLPDPQPVG